MFDFIRFFGAMAEKEKIEKKLQALFEEMNETMEGLSKKSEEECSIIDLEIFIKNLQSIVSQMQSAIRKMKEM